MATATRKARKGTDTIDVALTSMTTHVQALRGVEDDAFDLKVDAMADIGGDFHVLKNSLLDEAKDEAAKKRVTDNGTYSHFEKRLKGIIGRTKLVNECYPFFLARENGTLDDLKAKWRKVGTGSGMTKNADGTIPLRTDLFGQAVKAAADGRWNKGGSIRKVSGNAKTDAQKDAAFRKAYEDSPIEFDDWTIEEIDQVVALAPKLKAYMERHNQKKFRLLKG